MASGSPRSVRQRARSDLTALMAQYPAIEGHQDGWPGLLAEVLNVPLPRLAARSAPDR